jgi:glycosyltransferase involved in cell wall biosynthesis
MRSKGHIVVCSPVLPEFDREAGSRRLFHHVQMLRDTGWNVSYVTENPTREDRYVRALEQSGCPVYLGFGPRVDALFSLGHVDAAIIAFWYLAEQQMERIRSLSPGTRVLIDSIDLHFLRESRRLLGDDRALATGSPLNSQYADEFIREITSYARADGVMTVSQKEADVINDILGGPERASHVAQAETLTPSGVPFRDRRGMLFVGNFRHLPNLDAVEFLFRDIVPKLDQQLLARHPLTIIGNGLTNKVRSLAEGYENIRMVGWVPSLTPYYARARVSLVPLQYGAGTKRKVIESLMSGLPTVSTSVGVEGLDLVDGQHVMVADDPGEFADKIGHLISNSRLWRRLASEGSSAMMSSHSWAQVTNQLTSLVDRLGSQPRRTESWGPLARRKSAYETSVDTLADWLRNTLPGDAAVAVASKGDTNLLRLGGRKAIHLPSNAEGGYAGHHPSSSEDLLRELGAFVSGGGDHLVIPATSSWWLEHYAPLSRALAKDWINLCAPPELGHVFQHQFRSNDVEFQCNICGSSNNVARSLIDREMPSCQTCGSTPRSRALVESLTSRLFCAPTVLSDLGSQKEIRGLGLSDWDGYAQLLASRFEYVNTYFRSDPVLDIAAPLGQVDWNLDFVIASEVFDHVVGDMEQVFTNVRSMLKPDGVVVFTVPYVLDGPTVEYDGASDPASPTAGFTPARQFSLESLLYVLGRSGFKDIKVHDDVNRNFGIWWTPRVSVPISASTD